MITQHLKKHGVVHYSVANMPGAVPRTSTIALTNVTVPYALQIANKGVSKAISENGALKLGVNVAKESKQPTGCLLFLFTKTLNKFK